MSTSPGNTAPPSSLPENILLFLPSSLPQHIHALSELQMICKLEQCLREPQADDALAEIRHQRRVIQGLWQFKWLNVSGTGNRPNMRMLKLYRQFNDKTERAAAKYRTARNALDVLDPGGAWSKQMKELNKKDISGPGRDPEDTSTMNSHYEPSWIWLVPHASVAEMDENEFNENMQVEWVKARAHMRRWNEEVMIIKEEMRRVLAYHQWKAALWREQSFFQGDEAIVSGISGYAHKQAAISIQIAEQCAGYWLPYLKEKDIVVSWASEFENLLDDTGSQVSVQDIVGGEGEFDGDDDELDMEEGEDDDLFDFSDD
jgi:hypothetical protein